MEKRIRMGRRIAKISVLVIFALAFLTSPTWGQTGTISGTVTDADGEPIAGVRVSLQNDDGSSAGKATTSSVTGIFREPLPQATRLVALHFQRTLVARALNRFHDKQEHGALAEALAATESAQLDVEVTWR